MQQLSYQDQLADSRWLQKKAEVLIRDNYTCQKCGAKSYLNVHHKSYQSGKLAWEYPNEELITLCKDCHENEHDIVPIPTIGKFYTFYHSDYSNDMICYHIDYRNKLVYLFGVDDGCYGSGWIYVFTFDKFYERCKNSFIFNSCKGDLSDYTLKSFFLAYKDLQCDKVGDIVDSKFYTKEQIITFAKLKVKELIELNDVVINIFKQYDEEK
jgi:ribosomal protein S27AE